MYALVLFLLALFMASPANAPTANAGDQSDFTWRAELQAQNQYKADVCRGLAQGVLKTAYCGNFPINNGGGGGGGNGQAPCNFWVNAQTGSDGNNGTAPGTPFASLTKAQTAARNASGKVVCLEAATWTLTSTFTLTTADNGETWENMPNTVVDSPTIIGTGLFNIWTIGANNLTINGIKFSGYTNYGLEYNEATGGATLTGLLIENCDIGGGTATGTWNSGTITVDNVNGVTIKNNYLHDTPSEGMSLFAYESGAVLDNVLIENNVCERAVTGQTDGGCYYVSDHNGYHSSGNTIIENNYAKDVGASGSNQATSVYLDDSASYWTVKGNVLGPPNPAGSPASSGFSAMGVEVNNGVFNTVENNIIDIGPTTNVAAILFYYGDNPITSLTGPNQTGEVVENNILITNHAGSQDVVQWGNYQYPQFSGSASDYTIGPNLYFNYGSGNILTDGPIASDSNPKTENPDITSNVTNDYTYTLSGSSPIFSAPFNFTALTRGWGPVGFTIPISGQAPSY